VVEAVEQFARLLADRVRVLGADHPDTLRTRSSLAFLLGESGLDEQEIAGTIEQLVGRLRDLASTHVTRTA
jgi:hypothetical protein